jgi:hypothetical protein
MIVVDSETVRQLLQLALGNAGYLQPVGLTMNWLQIRLLGE